jgi:very-short-patch-repair endonuclease
MTSVERQGQPRISSSSPALRSRDTSGIPVRGHRALRYAKAFEALQALMADIGEPCWACGPTAAALHGFDGFELVAPFHVLVLRDRHVNRIGHVIHTIIDLAASVSREILTTAIDSAVRDRKSSEDFLHRRLTALRKRGRAGISDVLLCLAGIEVTKGGHSWLEREFLRLCDAAGLPKPNTQQVMGVRNKRLIRVDCHFPGTDLIVELLGYTFHRTVMQMQNDAERMNRLVLDGNRVLQFTYLDIVEFAEPNLALVHEALFGRTGQLQKAT